MKHDEFDSAAPSSMQDACYIRTQLNDLALMSSRSSVDRAPTMCLEVHGFGDIFFFPRLCHVEYFIFHISLPSSKFNIFIHLSLYGNCVIKYEVEVAVFIW